MSMAEENRIAQLEREVAALTARLNAFVTAQAVEQESPSSLNQQVRENMADVRNSPFPIKRGPGRPPNPPKDAA